MLAANGRHTHRLHGHILTAALATLFCVSTVALAEPVKQPGKWAQDYTGRQADPEVRFGQLPNGLRYAIMRNDRPEGAVSFRMRIGSGSLQEHDDERGLAHFIEHMAFRGSTNIADGEVVKMLERQGLKFGADTNAGTGYEQTVYQFDFPHADATAISTGLTLFREIGGRLKLDPAAIDAERGVLLSEERLRDTPAQRMTNRLFDVTLAGQRVPQRAIIGTVESLKSATSIQIRRYYSANYRPDNATIVVVGAVDVSDVEAKIKTMFADWAPAAPTEDIRLGDVAKRGAAATLYAAAGAPDLQFIAWERSYDLTADTDARERTDVIRLISSIILNRRLQEIAQTPDAAFLGARVSISSILKSAEQTQLVVQARKDHADEALKAVVAEQRRIVADGVRDDEVVSAKAQLESIFKTGVSGATTRQNKDVANAIISNVNDDSVVTSPAQDLAIFQKFANTITKTDIEAALKDAFSGAGPLVLRSTPDITAADSAKLDQALNAALTAPLTKSATLAVEPWPYAAFGVAGKIIARREIKVLGLTLVTFANGTRLAVKPTSFSKDRIDVQVSFGSGRLGIGSSLTHAGWLLGDGNAFLLGGTGKRTLTQIQRENESRIAAAKFSTFDDHFSLNGVTRNADFERQMQLLAAYASDPGFRPEGVTRLKNIASGQLAQIEAIPLAVLLRDGAPLLHNGDQRWIALPQSNEVDATVPGDVPALLKDALHTPMTISIVGDVSVEDAIHNVALTFGALPKYQPALAPVRTGIRLTPAGGAPITVMHKGRGDQGVLAEYWPTTDYYADPEDSYALRVASAIIQARLVDSAREKLGLTYSPITDVDASTSLSGYGYLAVINETKPESMAKFNTLIADVIADLANKPVAADEFLRAQKPLIDARQKAVQTNGYWLTSLTELQLDPRHLAVTRDYISGVAAVTPADVTRVAQRYLAGKTPLTIQVVHAAK